MSLKIYYAAGPGDVVATFRHWLKGKDDPSQYSVTYSSQFFDFISHVAGEALVVSSNKWPDRASDRGITVINRPAGSRNPKGKYEYRWGQIIKGLQMLCDLASYRPKYAVISEGTAPWLFTVPARLLGITIVPSLHCVLWPLIKRPNRFLKRLEWLAFRFATQHCLCASHEIIEQVRAISGESANCHLFYPTYRTEQFEKYTEPDWSSEPTRLLYLGRMERDKGVFHLLEAFSIVEKNSPGKFLLDLCGSGNALEILRDTAEKLETGSKATFHGHCQRTELEKQITAAHIIVVPTTSDFVEGFNQVVAEGVLSRRRVIATSVCPAARIFGEAVTVIEPDNPNSLAEAILTLSKQMKTNPSNHQSINTGESAKLLSNEMSFRVALEKAIKGTAPVIGYLVPQFPSQTHAFFWRELGAMREAGAKIQLLSTQPPSEGECQHDFAETARQETIYLSRINWRAAIRVLTRPLAVIKSFHYILSLHETTILKRLSTFRLIPCAAQLGVIAGQVGMSHVHLHSCADAAHIGALSRYFGGPDYSLTLHGDLCVYGTDHYRKFAGARWVSTVTRPLQKQVMEKAGLCQSKVPVIWMGVDVEKFTPTAKPNHTGALRLITVARLIPQKGHIHALEAVARVRKAGWNVHYHIAGSGPFESEIKSRIVSLGLSDHVTMTGSISEIAVRKLLDEADVFMLPSYGLGEAAPVSVMEAMACGLPVICSRIGGTPDMISHLEDGWLVHQQNEDELTEAILRFASDPDFRNKIGHAARHTALRFFDHRKNANALLAWIQCDHSSDLTGYSGGPNRVPSAI
jgi:colanic acid/amylovoran biosynthesis glycosyltransferase